MSDARISWPRASADILSCVVWSASAPSFSFFERSFNSSWRFCCFNRSSSSWSWMLADFVDFFFATAPVTAGVVAGTCAADWTATEGVAFGSKSVGKTIAGKPYTKSGLSGCLTDLSGVEAAMVEDTQSWKRGEMTHQELSQMSWSSFNKSRWLNEGSLFSLRRLRINRVAWSKEEAPGSILDGEWSGLSRPNARRLSNN